MLRLIEYNTDVRYYVLNNYHYFPLFCNDFKIYDNRAD